jgi:hypothetical protein
LPAQPFPTKPAPFDRQGVTVDDLIDLTPALKAEALDIVKSDRIGPLYTPPSVVWHEGHADAPLVQWRCQLARGPRPFRRLACCTWDHQQTWGYLGLGSCMIPKTQ